LKDFKLTVMCKRLSLARNHRLCTHFKTYHEIVMSYATVKGQAIKMNLEGIPK